MQKVCAFYAALHHRVTGIMEWRRNQDFRNNTTVRTRHRTTDATIHQPVSQAGQVLLALLAGLSVYPAILRIASVSGKRRSRNGGRVTAPNVPVEAR